MMINQLHYTTSNLRTPESINSSVPPPSTGPIPPAFQKSPDFSDVSFSISVSIAARDRVLLNHRLTCISSSNCCISAFARYSRYSTRQLTRVQDTSFNLAAQADNTLLTPDSATQSPQTQHTKFTATYPTPPSCSTSLLHDTPGNNRMYGQWSSSFDLNASSSQASSPMTAQPSMGAGFLSPYDHDHGGRRTPGPPEQTYMGSFGVSDSHALQSNGPPSYYVGLPALDHHNEHSAIMRDSPHSISDLRGVGRGPQPGSLLNHPAHHYRDDRRNSLTDSAYPNRSINGSPRSGSGAQSGRVRKPRRGKKNCSSAGKGTSHGDLVGEHMNCLGQEVPPMLKSTCPDEERCIFESRWHHRNHKGQDMWDGIQKDYQQRFGRPPPVKETLQMKFKRARSKYIEWLPEDVSDHWLGIAFDLQNLLNTVSDR